jgi:hypothetical protein
MPIVEKEVSFYQVDFDRRCFPRIQNHSIPKTFNRAYETEAKSTLFISNSYLNVLVTGG